MPTDLSPFRGDFFSFRPTFLVGSFGAKDSFREDRNQRLLSWCLARETAAILGSEKMKRINQWPVFHPLGLQFACFSFYTDTCRWEGSLQLKEKLRHILPLRHLCLWVRQWSRTPYSSPALVSLFFLLEPCVGKFREAATLP